ncbi:MAG TPA: carboxypeptidase regulatory-like domain-containing protein [Dongiaceae bacterium]|nr:carboxypeptidase regulatory-like domain-containing protein [Dongiaceae bacterium]
MTLAFGSVYKRRVYALALLLLGLAIGVPHAPAQTPPAAQTATGAIHGQVTDPSGAAVVGANVLALPAGGAASSTAVTTRDGLFDIKGLAPGKYTVQVFADGFAHFESKEIVVAAGAPFVLNVRLSIQEQQEKVVVSDTTTQLDTSGANNANSVVLKGKDLDALSDDPDELQDELTALAGPSAGPNGGQIYIDGFTAGQLPPKSSIREIRINQNPFSAEYDQLGYGRIEILTKPGTDKLHGQFMINGNDSAFNARNPFLGDADEPSYHSILYSGNIGGALSKKASFFFSIDRRNIDEISVVNTPALDANFQPIQFTDAVPNPRTRTNLTPRLDYQLTPTNTLTLRYQYFRENETNNGVGQFNLPSQAYNSLDTEHTLQVSDTQTLSERIINETRFQYVRSNGTETVLDTTPSVSVSGAFTGGGNPQGNLLQTTDGYEIQNYTSIALAKHFIKFGARARIDRDSADRMQGFNGSFTFNSLTAYQITEQGLANGLTPDQIRAAGGGASLFTLTAGTSLVQNTYYDLGLYVQDEWRVRPNITVNFGLRYERQNQIYDDGGLAPRLGFAWGIGKTKQGSPKFVVRGGFGIFYTRFKQQYLENAQLLNGINQQSYVVTNPDFFPNLPTASELANSQTAPTIYQVDPKLHTPYLMQYGATLEKQITKNANVAFTYLYSRGVHQFVSRNINAPLPPAYDPNDRPLGTDENVYEYESGGDFKQNQFIVNGNVRVGTRVSLFSYYTLNYANSDTSGATSFPANQYDLALDYGRAAFDIRQRLFLGGSISLPYSFRFSPFMVASSGVPFNVVTGVDSNNDSLFTDRPTYSQFQAALAGATIPGNISFNCAPAAGQTLIPVNCGQGPARFSLNVRLSKTIGFGEKSKGNQNTQGGPPQGGTFGRGPGGPGGRGNRGGGMFMDASSGKKYTLTFGISARNLLNNVNEGQPIGVISSPIFGQANSLAGGPFGSQASNRRVDLQVTFGF